MAARRHPNLSQAWKDKIQTSMLINRLQSCINGKCELTGPQVTAALGLLKKVAPDLSSVAVGGDPDAGPVSITWAGK